MLLSSDAYYIQRRRYSLDWLSSVHEKKKATTENHTRHCSERKKLRQSILSKWKNYSHLFCALKHRKKYSLIKLLMMVSLCEISAVSVAWLEVQNDLNFDILRFSTVFLWFFTRLVVPSSSFHVCVTDMWCLRILMSLLW